VNYFHTPRKTFRCRPQHPEFSAQISVVVPGCDWHAPCFAPTVKRRVPSTTATLARSAEGGFTLVEILVTVIIIGLMSAMAFPVLGKGMKDRRTRQTAEEIARVFREARLRAVGRGSAVLVHYVDGNRTFEVREAVMGPPEFNPSAVCTRLPATSCIEAHWTDNENTGYGSQLLETYAFDRPTEVTGIKVFLGLPSAATTRITEFSVCFTPLGRTYAVAGPPIFTSATVMNYAPVFRVWRTAPGDTKAFGLERRVTLLPNGQTRMHSATETSP
jgi:prepilin-type N-terminal cleavage/methylation domain-containing protein